MRRCAHLKDTLPSFLYPLRGIQAISQITTNIVEQRLKIGRAARLPYASVLVVLIIAASFVAVLLALIVAT